MKILKSFLTVTLGLLCTGILAQNPLQKAVAPGNKVLVQIVNDEENPIPDDEIDDVTTELAATGAWECVEEISEADFILCIEAKKKMVFNSPRTWLTPSVLDKENNLLWKGDTYKADATMFNGFRATSSCIKTVIEKGFQKNLFKKAGR